ncbi:MAG: DUF2062 domain-containing protein [Deltaproteobacteria bacterium]|nr:DUF2062 domain-containing protein [Deltaproteobacteria bacterium]
MNFRRTVRYYWLNFRRLQGNPQKLAWGMALGVFIGITPTIPFHTVAVLTLAAILRVSPVTAYIGIWVMNPITMAPLYILAYKVGAMVLLQGNPLRLPEVYNFHTMVDLLWRGGLALQAGGVIIALPPAVISYFLTLWLVQRYRRQKTEKAAGVLHLPQNPPEPAGPET